MEQPKKSKVPKKLPDFLVKAVWANTAINIIVSARDVGEAWDKAWKKVSRMEGGNLCLKVVVQKQL